MENLVSKELHRITTTCIIYNDKHEFLITKRSPTKKAFPNLWTVPGGGLEVDDYINTPKTTGDVWYYGLENTLRREVTEEVNVEIGRPNFLLDMTFIRPDGVPVVILSFYAPYVSGEVKLDEDSTEFAWVTFEEAKKYKLIEGILSEIEMVDRILKGENPEDIKFNY